MPSSVVKSFARKTNKSVSEVESKWEEAKKQVDREYPNVKKDSDQYYKLVTSITKSMIGLRESFNDLVDRELDDLNQI